MVSEVILDSPVWVHTQDGTVYPAPAEDGRGHSWGYSGTGPRTLATLIGRLLDDGASPAVTYSTDNDTEPHLLRFLTDKYRPGTVLSRSLLQQIRRNGPHLSPIDRFKIGRPRKKKHHPVRDWLLRFLAPRPADASLRNGIVPTARGAMLRRG